jgi:plastocyanin
MKLAALGAIALGLATTGPGPTAQVSIPGQFYSPGQLDVLTGTTVTWQNQDATTHTVTADDGTFDSGYVPPGGSYERLFSKPGIYAFHCTIHRFMQGVIRVYALVLSGPDHPVAAGGPVVLTGRAPAGSKSVLLERSTVNGWRTVSQKALPPGGAFLFRAVASSPARYRARAGAVASPVVRVDVAPHVTVRRLAGGRLGVTTQPARPGATAVLQAYDRERFSFVGGTTAKLGANGGATFALPGGRAHVRVLVRGSAGWSDATSRVLLVR